MNDAPEVLQLDFPEPDIARLTWNDPHRTVNVLSRHALQELTGHLDHLEQRHQQTPLAGLIVCSAKPGCFLSGADLQDLAARWANLTAAAAAAGSQLGQQLFQRLSALPFPTVAVIAGSCLGGGAELASWCDFRVVADDPQVEIGFPEVQLGIIPAWGGTTRLPRLIGLGPAIEWITSGQSVTAASAHKSSWADRLVAAPPHDLPATGRTNLQTNLQPGSKTNSATDFTAVLLSTAQELIRSTASTTLQQRRQKRRAALLLSDNELGLLRIAATAQLRSGPPPAMHAPQHALALLLEQARLNEAAALTAETHCFQELSQLPTVTALLNVFLLRKRTSYRPSVTVDVDLPRQHVGVVGAGIMGAGIAAAHLKQTITVSLLDAAPDALAKAAHQVVEEAAYDRESKQVQAQRAIRAAAALRPTTELTQLATCDLVIEAIVESAEAKRAVFQQLETLVTPQTILATNTSTIPITKLAARLEHPERFVGLHFFNPVRRMPLVEVIRGEKTSEATIATVVAHAKRIGKMPIVVRDGPGFLVNRLLFPYMNEAIELLSDGASIEAIERAARQFGMPLGPLELYDMVGLDTAVYAGRVMWEAFPQRVRPLPIIPAMIKSGRLGQKNHQGFFRYETTKKTPQPDPSLMQLLQQYRRAERQFTSEEITRRLFLPMLIEAALTLQDGIVSDPRDIDFGLIFGLGFPSFRGGLLYWADRQGLAALVTQIEEFTSLGERFAVPELLRSLASRQATFYGACQEDVASDALRRSAQPIAATGGAR
ncbi:MAG: 3-hydroxyacyl-CoA dehydrogenase NAD-binding domain-containing protein [Planctomycetota bacterium]